jgi:predicted HTH domain antitoxin
LPAARKNPFKLPEHLELERIVSLDDAAKVAGLSKDVLAEQLRDKIIQLSPRRQGIRLKHALRLA